MYVYTSTRLEANVLRVYASATPDEQEQGLRWYSDARHWTKALAKRHDIPLDVCASVVAALSPNCAWGQNKRDAERLLDVYAQGYDARYVNAATYGPNVLKAWAIRDTGDTALLHGPKVTAFRDCIINPRTRSVCVDVHAYCIATGEEHTVRTVPHIGLPAYRAIAQAYRVVARRVGLAPYRVQAVCWVVRRRLLSGKHDQFSLPLR